MFRALPTDFRIFRRKMLRARFDASHLHLAKEKYLSSRSCLCLSLCLDSQASISSPLPLGFGVFVIEHNHGLAVVMFGSGGDLSSRTVASQVLSALQSLTSVFGMGTGVTSA